MANHLKKCSKVPVSIYKMINNETIQEETIYNEETDVHSRG